MIKTIRLLTAIAALAALGWPALVGAAETLLLHGSIYTADARGRFVQALAIEDSRITAVGTDAQSSSVAVPARKSSTCTGAP
jgi:predicted amidohydrolase YtcJ